METPRNPLDDAFETMDFEVVRRAVEEHGMSKLDNYMQYVNKAIKLGDSHVELLEVLLANHDVLHGRPLPDEERWREGNPRTLEVLWTHRRLWKSNLGLLSLAFRYLRETNDEFYARFCFYNNPKGWRQVLTFCQSIDFAQDILRTVTELAETNSATRINDAGERLYQAALYRNDLEMMRFLRAYNDGGALKERLYIYDLTFMEDLLTRPLNKEVILEVLDTFPYLKTSCAYAFYLLGDEDLIDPSFNLAEALESMHQPEADDTLQLVPDTFVDLLLYNGIGSMPEHRLRELLNEHITAGKRAALRAPPISELLGKKYGEEESGRDFHYIGSGSVFAMGPRGVRDYLRSLLN